MDNLLDIIGKVIIVTGAAMGWGEGIANAFARYGGTVIIADKNETKGNKTAQIIRDCGGKSYN